MGDYQIKCVNRDSNGFLINVGTGGVTFPVEHVAEWINMGKHTFYNKFSGFRADVRPYEDSRTGRVYFTIARYHTFRNNLNDLSPCL
jgi:hypothetical protein